MIKVQIEAERKFLMKRGFPVNKLLIEQKYAEDGRVYRAQTKPGMAEPEFMIITKQPILDTTSIETIEYIPVEEVDDFILRMSQIRNLIRKRRAVIDAGNGIQIMIDTYINIDLATLEIEYIHEGVGDKAISEAHRKVSDFELPEEYRKNVIKEVTGDPAFSNRNLAQILPEETTIPLSDHKILD